MATALERILGAPQLKIDADCPPDTAAAVVISFVLIALSDEVLTVSERQTVVAVLENEWSIRVAPDAVLDLFERLAVEPRHVLLRDLEEHCRTWPLERSAQLMRGLREIVCADGFAAWGEEVLLRRFSAALNLAEFVLPGSARDPRVLSAVDLQEGQPPLRVGHSLRAEICLPRAPIADYQLRLTLRNGRIAFEDIGQPALVAVGGRTISKGTLEPGDELSLGRYRIRFGSDGRQLLVMHPGFATTLQASGVTATVRQDGRKRSLLHDVTFQVRAGEMVAILGPSGSGKSTLLHVLRGELRAARGHATLDGVEIAPGASAAIRRISFVPQDELLLAALTVEESVSFAARLKGLDVSGRPGTVASLVDEMLERVGLANQDVRRTPIGDVVRRGISGGQRRRVSVAQELVGDDTDVLLLDEPTSGLDPHSEIGITGLMRDIADSGRIVVAATHAVETESLRAFDKVLCLDSNGGAAYFGPPSGAPDHFRARNVIEIFERLNVDPSAGPEPEDETSTIEVGDGFRANRAPRPRAGVGWARQLGVLLQREVKTRSRDPASLSLAVALPVAVAGLCSLVYYRGCVHPILLFVVSLAGLWAGVSLTVRDIISQFALLRHESRTRAALGAAYSAKVVIATAASAVQAALLTAAIFWVFGARTSAAYADWPDMLGLVSLMSPPMVFLVLWGCHLFGNAVGSLLSSSFRTAEAAIFMIPFVLLPMVAFSGALVPPTELPRGLAPLVRANPLYQSYVGLLGSSASVCTTVPINLADPSKTDLSANCRPESRTNRPPDGLVGLAPFVQSEGSCLHNVFLRAGEFCESAGLPRPALSPHVRGQLNAPSVARSVGVLIGLSIILHLCALAICRRRMSTL